MIPYIAIIIIAQSHTSHALAVVSLLAELDVLGVRSVHKVRVVISHKHHVIIAMDLGLGWD